MNIIAGLTGSKTRSMGQENVIVLHRDISPKEEAELLYLVEKAEKQLRMVEKNANEVEKEIYVKKLLALKKYMKEKQLEARVDKRPIEMQKLKFRSKGHSLNGLSINADGNFDDQQDEFIEISGKMSLGEVSKIRGFATEMADLDRQIEQCIEKGDLTAARGLSMQYEDCKKNMVGFVQGLGGSCKSVPVNKKVKAKEKEKTYEKRSEQTHGRELRLERK